jgi:hypothetical protein
MAAIASRIAVLGAILAILPLVEPPSCYACPFCSAQGQTLTTEISQASLVLYGTLMNAKLDANAGFGQGTTDMKIDAVLKSHEILGDQKVITLPRYVPSDNAEKKILVFCDVFKGKLDPYRGMPVNADGEMVKYLQGALAVKDKDMPSRLKFFFKFLDSKDAEVSNDAYKEFAYAEYKDYEGMAKELPADKIAAWLANPDTPQFRYGLYASMLGHCGTEKHAAVLKEMLADPNKKLASGIDGVLAGYIMLKRKEGWSFTSDMLRDGSKEFPKRYAALRAARFFWEFRPDLVSKKDIVNAVSVLLDQNDIADLAIEDFRKWKSWDQADRIEALYGKPSHDVPIIRRAILRYMLSCPGPKAAAFVERIRQKDPEMVKDVEELLKLEAPAPPAPAAKSATTGM